MAAPKDGANGKGNGHAPPGAARPPLDMAATLRDRTFVLTGGTGFLGKVVLSMLLRHHPDVRRVYVLVRGGSGPRGSAEREAGARARWEEEIVRSPCLSPVRESLGDAAFEAFMREKVVPVAADIEEEGLGLTDARAQELADEADAVLHCAGLVDFFANLEQALRVNTLAPRALLRFAQRKKGLGLMHVSTCYVPGNMQGHHYEDEFFLEDFPYRDRMPGTKFALDQEIADCQRIIARSHEEADDQERSSQLLEAAREKLERRGVDPDDAALLDEELRKTRKRWIEDELKRQGLRRAEHWGWPNTYTYTKSLGEQLVIRANQRGEVPVTVVRPAVIESAWRYPFAGWNQGVNTSAPLVYLSWRGHRMYPFTPELVLDVVPVDLVASVVLMAAAALLRGEHQPVYQAATSDSNPLPIHRLVELTALKNRRWHEAEPGGELFEKVLANLDMVVAPTPLYKAVSAPGLARFAKGFRRALDLVPADLEGGLGRMARFLKSGTEKLSKGEDTVDFILGLYLPYTRDLQYTFHTDNVRAAWERLGAADRVRYPWDPEDIDWRTYWMDIHCEGLRKWSFPSIEAKLKPEEEGLPSFPRTLLEVFDVSTTEHANRVALQILDDEGIEKFTYAEVRAAAERVAGFLRARGVKAGDRVLLVSENRPEWGISYFGVLAAGGSCVPVDPELGAETAARLAADCEARGVISSPKYAERLRAVLQDRPVWVHQEIAFDPAGEVRRVPLRAAIDRLVRARQGEIERGPAEPGRLVRASAAELERPPAEPGRTVEIFKPGEAGSPLASLIYTSGTTGDPKGVMLTHTNFSSLVAILGRVFDLGPKDNLLSVLPLHHTFEFTAGLLLPLSRGASVTYVKEISSKSLQRAFEQTPVTAMIGVPALWQLLWRKIRQNVAARGPAAEVMFDRMVEWQARLRDQLRVNLGPFLFGAVHRFFGGRIRYLISGGAPLQEDIFRGFYGMGFDLLEGYGLTETSPVLTVNRPGEQPKPGTVGKALPGIDIKLHDLRDDGTGEIIARGPNVMAGYYGDPEATDAVLKDGWLHTGDLGKIDSKGRVFVVGRIKEVIVDSGGKNIYPDELEELYASAELIKELCVLGVEGPDGDEQVACLCVPSSAAHPDMSRAALYKRVQEHFAAVSAKLPQYKRVKTLRFWDKDLPRTRTRKVKRNEVRDIMRRLARVEDRRAARAAKGAGDGTGPGAGGRGGNGEGAADAGLDAEQAWLVRTLKDLAGVEEERVVTGAHLTADLGLDSLGFTELAVAIEEHTEGMHIGAEELSRVATVGELMTRLGARQETGPVEGGMATSADTRRYRELTEAAEVKLPPRLGKAGKSLIGRAQRALYERLLQTEVLGASHIPYDRNCIVVANHQSHLDTGLVKYALADYGQGIVTVAAQDYFYDTAVKRAYFDNFTNMIPFDRHASLVDSLEKACEVILQGKRLLMFPEGTRSPDGRMQDFKPGVGYLVLKTKSDVLPVYLEGTYDALPKGGAIPKGRKVRATIGPVVPYEALVAQCDGEVKAGNYKVVARTIQRAVEALRPGARRASPAGAGAGAGAGTAGAPAWAEATAGAGTRANGGTGATRAYGEASGNGDPAAMLRALFGDLEKRFQPKEVDRELTYYFSLGDEPGCKWTIIASPQRCTIVEGKQRDQADCVLKTTPDVFSRLMTERDVPVTLFTSQAAKTNNVELLLTFRQAFGLGAV
ncbi:MAG TPA: AMP-binding protein [Myxococcota bacterium]|jgi:long-chain acyl-CoA synthetase|nr:AMP-binding protein [Myxococcota bacterium]